MRILAQDDAWDDGQLFLPGGVYQLVIPTFKERRAGAPAMIAFRVHNLEAFHRLSSVLHSPIMELDIGIYNIYNIF